MINYEIKKIEPRRMKTCILDLFQCEPRMNLLAKDDGSNHDYCKYRDNCSDIAEEK